VTGRSTSRAAAGGDGKQEHGGGKASQPQLAVPRLGPQHLHRTHLLRHLRETRSFGRRFRVQPGAAGFLPPCPLHARSTCRAGHLTVTNGQAGTCSDLQLSSSRQQRPRSPEQLIMLLRHFRSSVSALGRMISMVNSPHAPGDDPCTVTGIRAIDEPGEGLVELGGHRRLQPGEPVEGPPGRAPLVRGVPSSGASGLGAGPDGVRPRRIDQDRGTAKST